ncbi:MAG: hypothetical protein AAGD96_29045 [Chloroflexota bacterium]
MARPLQRSLRNIMWLHCGVVRTEDGLFTGLDELNQIRESSLDLDVRPSSEGYQDLALALDLRASLESAEATIRSAIERRETRGAHNRSDYPEIDPAMKKNFVVVWNEDGQQVLKEMEIDPLPVELERWMNDSEIEVAGRLLE